MWAGNSQCCGLTWNLFSKWVFNGETVVGFLFVCIYHHPTWLFKFNSLTILTAGVQKNLLILSAGGSRAPIISPFLCCGYWRLGIDVIIDVSLSPCGLAAAKSIQKWSWLMIKPLIRHFWWCFCGNIQLLRHLRTVFWLLGGFSSLEVHDEMALVGIDERSQKPFLNFLKFFLIYVPLQEIWLDPLKSFQN